MKIFVEMFVFIQHYGNASAYEHAIRPISTQLYNNITLLVLK